MPDCRFDGNGDLYGPGVRISLYLQFVTGELLALGASPASPRVVRTGTNIVATGTALCAAISLARADATALPIDFLLTYYLSVMLFGGETLGLHWNLSAVGGDNGCEASASLAAQHALSVAYSLFGAWFWARGIDRLPLFQAECAWKVAIFAPLDINAVWRHFATAASAIAAIYSFLGLVVVLLALGKRAAGTGHSPDSEAAKSREDSTDDTRGKAAREPMAWMRALLRTSRWLFATVSAISVEVMLLPHINGIARSSLDTTGETLALIISIMSSCTAVYDASKEARNRRKRRSPTDSRASSPSVADVGGVPST